MQYPNFKEEKKLWKKGYKFVVGLDEVGRGALSGPVIASAVVVIKNSKLETRNSKQFRNSNIPNSKRFGILDLKNSDFFRISDLEFRILVKEIKDSKKLSANRREKLYKFITKSPFIKWGIGRVSEKVIDKINIQNAAELAMHRAIKNLEKKYSHERIRIAEAQRAKARFSHADFLIIDGNRLNSKKLKARSYKLIIKADEKVFSCAAASIIAKVRRDRTMQGYHKEYPKYGFGKHKGYGTKLHKKMLEKYGHCKIHRKSFKPVKLLKS